MILSWFPAKQSLKDVCFLVVDVFTTGQREKGFNKSSVVLLLVCSFFSLLLSSLLWLYLLFSLDYETAVAGGVAGCFGVLLTVALFLSKRVRCSGTLFVISVFMKKSRNLLLTAGTSLVILKNIRNTLQNLTGLARSMVCNLEMKKAYITAHFSNCLEMLKWVEKMLKGITDFGLFKLDNQLEISHTLDSTEFSQKLSEAGQKLNETVKYVHSVMTTVSSVSDRMFPAISFFVLMMFIVLHIKKYCSDMKYKNRFVTGKFVCFDAKQRAEGKRHVLPLTPDEKKLYAVLPSAPPDARERRALLKFCVPVASHFLLWVLFIAVDVLLYYFINIVTTKLSELEPLHISWLTSITDIGSLFGIAISEENHKEDFSFSVTLFEKECLPAPTLLLHSCMFPLAVVLLCLIIMVLISAKVSQLRLLVCERFFPTAAEKRVEYLHALILRKRSKGRTQNKPRSLTSLIIKPHFWCPLLFRPKEPPESVV
ncbi:hypothetical protein Q5P01_010814 [Channa striata]|uniref:Dendritic cell-specific transmembrane protein-like domain-containing protein n=1 Tax=Channa striata TaxID=64152 RepID=A0AA88MSA9_CHASR|nr:hypothetical protein Q5P01_010814 [Channa striata]